LSRLLGISGAGQGAANDGYAHDSESTAMLLSSIEFLFNFLPVVLLVYYALP